MGPVGHGVTQPHAASAMIDVLGVFTTWELATAYLAVLATNMGLVVENDSVCDAVDGSSWSIVPVGTGERPVDPVYPQC